MQVTFRELAGSPVEEYTANGFSARREFLVPWNERDAFASLTLGLGSEFAGFERVAYPGKASVLAVKLRYEPFDPDTLDLQTLEDLAEDLNQYSGSFAKAVVDYRTFGACDREDGPTNEPGTYLTYRMMFASEYQPIAPRGWSWESDAQAPPAEDLMLSKRIPITEHHLTWRQVVNPPWEAIQSLQGTVNADEFLGCPAETLLCEGADANKLYSAGLEQGPSAFTWEIRYVFRQRAIKYGGQTYGWNHFYRETDGAWDRLLRDGGPLYDTADFAPLFQTTGDNT